MDQNVINVLYPVYYIIYILNQEDTTSYCVIFFYTNFSSIILKQIFEILNII